jgi:flagellin
MTSTSRTPTPLRRLLAPSRCGSASTRFEACRTGTDQTFGGGGTGGDKVMQPAPALTARLEHHHWRPPRVLVGKRLSPAHARPITDIAVGLGRCCGQPAIGRQAGRQHRGGSNAALKTIDAALNQINSNRAALGAIQNRFASTISNLNTATENLSASRSRIQDTDFAAETANLTRGQILQQAGTAMLAQANSLPNGVLSLLRG